MNGPPFRYLRVLDEKSALEELRPSDRTPKTTNDDVALLAGGTTLIDLMRLGVMRPNVLVDVSRLPLTQIEASADGLTLGAMARNSDVANHALVKERFPVLSQALLSGASPQLRNLATVGGNLLQRTRCAYFRDVDNTACNKRKPGSGCAALEGWTRMHAVLGTSPSCIATHPSDMSVALVALDAVVRVRGPKGERTIPIGDFHTLPGDHPEVESVLMPGEMIVSVFLPSSPFAKRSHYVKARDRSAYAFALASCAGCVELDAASGTIKQTRIALGGVATKPWRSIDAEAVLAGKRPSPDLFRQAGEVALKGAQSRPDNAFKIELSKRVIARSLELALKESAT